MNVELIMCNLFVTYLLQHYFKNIRICHIFNSQTFHWDLHEWNMLDCSYILH